MFFYTTSILGCLDTIRHCNSTKMEYYGQYIELETVVKLENDNIVTPGIILIFASWKLCSECLQKFIYRQNSTGSEENIK